MHERSVTLPEERAPSDGSVEDREMCGPASFHLEVLMSVGLGPFQALMADVASSHLIEVGSGREARGPVVETQRTSRVVTCHRPLRDAGQVTGRGQSHAKTSEIATTALVDRADLRGCRARTCRGA